VGVVRLDACIDAGKELLHALLLLQVVAALEKVPEGAAVGGKEVDAFGPRQGRQEAYMRRDSDDVEISCNFTSCL
jgi:hypothetical protein